MARDGRGDWLRAILLIAVTLGAVASVIFTVMAGHRNPSYVLMAMFVVWVLSPYGLLAWLTTKFTAWRTGLPAAVTVVLSLVPPAIYATAALGPHRSHTAGPFLVVPASSGLVIAFVLLTTKVTTKSLDDSQN